MDSVQSLLGTDPAVQNQDIRDLARKLTNTDPLKFGLLQCRGVVKVRGEQGSIVSYDFMFHTPPSLKSPQSLRKVLIDAKSGLSLSARFHVAQQIAQSLSYVHTYGFVHKGIRPETILIFQDDDSELAASFLLGFEKFRPSQRQTLHHGDSEWQKNLYRHPQRQGLKPEAEYIMQHDIYSLGVCLLEIGLWQTLVLHHLNNTQTTEHPTGLSVNSGGGSIPSPFLPEFKDLESGDIGKASLIKEFLIHLAKEKLPSKMGDKYTNIVVSCLTCLDESNPDFSDQSEFQDEDDIIIGVRYIEKVSVSSDSLKVFILNTSVDSAPT
jgi:serine/threonine protein kinase